MTQTSQPPETKTGEPAPATEAPAGSGSGESELVAAARAAGGDSSTHFLFEHKVFSVSGAYFASAATDKSLVVFNVPLGSTFGAVPLNTLRGTFQIAADSNDDRLLKVVESSLRYVKVIRPGESIPRELLDGSASWSVSEENRIRARNRVRIQLASWVSGHEIVISDPSQIEQIVEDPKTQEKVEQAYVSLTERLGLPPDKRGEVEEKLNGFAHELSYIEGLRDRYGAVRMILEKLDRLRTIYRLDRTFADEMMQMLKLFRTPILEFQSIFDQVDAQSGEILSLMKTLDSQVAFTRRMRDDLHSRFMDWDDMIAKWEQATVERSTANEALVKSTYRFLAQRYLKTNVWKRE